MNSYVEAIRKGAFDYLEKPLTPSELAELVKWHLGTGGPARSDLREKSAQPASDGHYVH